MSSSRKEENDASEKARQAAHSVQSYRTELAPTPEQRTQHAGLARVAENFYLEQIPSASEVGTG